MDENDSGHLQFRGQDATECEDFMTAIVRRAFAQGKQRDDQWMTDFASTCMVNDAMRWWGALDEEVQGSWKLLRRAMLSKYRPMFDGGSGEEAEKFVRAVRDKAIEEGKRKDNEWIVTYAESCLTGEALRWHAYLDSDIKSNWEKLQQALLTRYPRGGSDGLALGLVPTSPAAAPPATTPKATRRGRIRVSNSSASARQYLSKRFTSDHKITLTASLTDALEVEWNAASDGLQKLSIPSSQIRGYNVLGLKWLADPSQMTHHNLLGICAVDNETRSINLSGFSGDLLTYNWKISSQSAGGDVLTLLAMAGQDTLYPRWTTSTNFVFFATKDNYTASLANMFLEPI